MRLNCHELREAAPRMASMLRFQMQTMLRDLLTRREGGEDDGGAEGE
jgi:hypothetical protein